MQKSIFSKAERLAVEDKFRDNIIYKSLRGTTLRLMNGANAFRLSPEELFYLVCYEIDCIREKAHDEMVGYCRNEVWAELYAYFRYEKEIEDADKDIDLACVSILRAVGELLFRSTRKEYFDAASALLLTVQHHISNDFNRTLDVEFRMGFESIDSDKFATAISDYLQGEAYCSDEINKLLDSLEIEETAETSFDRPASGIRIANGKKTSVLVVLNAMYKAGWLKGPDGEKLTNRDKTLNEILKHAFNDECKNIPQLLNPTGCTDPEGHIDNILNKLREKI